MGRGVLLQEEALDVVVLDVFALGEDAQHRQRRKVGYPAQLRQDVRHEVLLAQLRFHEVFESVDP